MVVVDLREFPSLSLYPVDTKVILRWIRTRGFTLNGISPRRFEAWVNEEFDLTYQAIDLPIPTPLLTGSDANPD